MHRDARMSEWGNPAGAIPPPAEQGRTRGTETSQYPQEKKITMIPQVVASERGGAQTRAVEAAPGVVGPPVKDARTLGGPAGKPGRRG